MNSRYRKLMTQPTERQVREGQKQAEREAQVRKMKDLANEPYMGKNE